MSLDNIRPCPIDAISIGKYYVIHSYIDEYENKIVDSVQPFQIVGISLPYVSYLTMSAIDKGITIPVLLDLRKYNLIEVSKSFVKPFKQKNHSNDSGCGGNSLSDFFNPQCSINLGGGR